MTTKQIIAAAVLMASVVLNALFINERLEKRFYRKGVNDGARQLGDRLVTEVRKSQAINVKMPDGETVTLATLEAFRKQLAARQAQRVPAMSKQEPVIDAMQGTIDRPAPAGKPREVNKP